MKGLGIYDVDDAGILRERGEEYLLRCQSCRHSEKQHTDGKCLYGSGKFLVWVCSNSRCEKSDKRFQMVDRIYLTDDGRYYHPGCKPDEFYFDGERRIKLIIDPWH
jgi:hypothetical protein